MLTVALTLPICTWTLCSRPKVLVNNLTDVQHVEHSQIVTEHFAERLCRWSCPMYFFKWVGFKSSWTFLECDSVIKTKQLQLCGSLEEKIIAIGFDINLEYSFYLRTCGSNVKHFAYSKVPWCWYLEMFVGVFIGWEWKQLFGCFFLSLHWLCHLHLQTLITAYPQGACTVLLCFA